MSDIDAFFAGSPFAVVGASDDRAKFGNKVLRCYWDHGLTAYPVNPKRATVEGQPCFSKLADVPGPLHGVSLITQPDVGETIVEEAAALGIERLWFQPGSESPRALAAARRHKMSVIAGGPCVLVELPRRPRG